MVGLSPSQNEKDQMKRLMQIASGKIPTVAEENARRIAEDPNAPIYLPGKGVITREDTSEMTKIMENYSSATGVKSFRSIHDDAAAVVSSLVDDSYNDKELKEALLTQSTDRGVKIGAWEIYKSQREGLTKKPENVYNIVNVNTNENVKASFMILESAKAVVALLNRGIGAKDSQIQEIAKLELSFRRLREKALHEKMNWHRANRNDDEFKKDLYEAKFEAAKSQALYIKEQVKNIYHRL